MTHENVDWRVYVILDPDFVPQGRSLLQVATEALTAGARVLQLRDKGSTGRVLYERASTLAALCHQHGALFIVNDRLDIALASGADGVHLGPHDMPVDVARRLGPSLVIGGSAGTVERALELVEAGVDYLGVGAVFEARAVKEDASAPRGPEIITAVTRAVSVPVVGIGGITADNAAAVRAAGASGVAVIREVIASDDPARAVKILQNAMA
jgi:thiamine-phosphate pyrophosphorylase